MIIVADSVLNCLTLILFAQVFQICHYKCRNITIISTVEELLRSPFILWVDAAFYPLIDQPLGVPDRGEVGDGVEAVTVSVPRIGHVHKSKYLISARD